MANYIPPNIGQLPFRFTSGGYSKPGFRNVPFDFKTRVTHSQTANLQAAINVMGVYKTSTYSYVKFCPTYVVGYSKYGVQILKGRCVYGGIRDVGASIEGVEKIIYHGTKDLSALIRSTTQSYSDLSAYLKTFIQDTRDLSVLIRPTAQSYSDLQAWLRSFTTETKDLSALIRSTTQDYGDLSVLIRSTIQSYSDLSALIRPTIQSYSYFRACIRCVVKDEDDFTASIYGWDEKDLFAYIGTHPPVDITAYLHCFLRTTDNLFAYIRGWTVVDLSVFLGVMIPVSLSASITPVPYFDLHAYLKVWPQRDLSAKLYGWGQRDLYAHLHPFFARDLTVYIGTHPWKNLFARIKGYVREAHEDLLAFVRGFVFSDLTVFIGPMHIKDLSAYLVSVRPIDITAFIYGWDCRNLAVQIIGTKYPYDLLASIVGTGAFSDLTAHLNAKIVIAVLYDLSAKIVSWNASDLSAVINVFGAPDLHVYINAVGGTRDLFASIYPKMIHLTSIITIHTMEHLDLTAVINPSCIWSDYRNLSAYIKCCYKSDITATILGKVFMYGIVNLTATIGYSPTYTVIDKLPISIGIKCSYRVEDKLPISFHIFRRYVSLSASITGMLRTHDLTAAITAIYLDAYSFKNTKSRERVFKFKRGHLEWYKIVELSFKSIVEDYFYVGAENKVYKINKTQKWLTDVKSYMPEDVALNIRRKLFKMMTIYDISKFSNIDEAIRFAIEYVTVEPFSDLESSIDISGGLVELAATIRPVGYAISSTSNLLANIIPREKTFIVGLESGIEKI